MSGGSETTTNVNKTGLGDKQYKGLMKRTTDSAQYTQGVVNDTADATQGLIKDKTKAINTTTRNQNNLTRDAVSADGSKTRKQMDSGFAQVGDDLSAGFEGVNANTDAGFAETGAAIGDLSGQVGNVGQQVTEVGNNLSSGFEETNANVTQGFADNTAANQGIADAASAERTQNFTSLSDLLAGGFGDAADQLSNAQTQILTGQNGLNDALMDNRTRMDTFYSGLADGQAGIADQVGGLATGFQDFNTQYGQDVTIANKARADMATGMDNGFAQVQDNVANATTAVEQGQQRLMGAVGGPSAAQAATGFSEPIQQPQQAPQSATGQTQPVTQLLSQAMAMATNPQVDPNLRQRFGILASSFNPDGQLIPNTTLSDGSTVIRQMDNNGNLRFQTNSINGQAVSSGAINVRDTFSLLNQTQGSNSFATPYSQTM